MASPVFEPTPAPRDRAAINRENARHSTGPRSDSGKNRVRLNALKHGALSRTVVLPFENQSAFDALGAKLTAAYQPANSEQQDALTAIQGTHWRLDRVLSIEAHLYTVGIKEQLGPARGFFPQLTPEAHIELARTRGYRQDARTFDQLHRQEMRLRRLLDRQVEAFLDLQSAPPEPQSGSPDSPAEPAPEPEIARGAGAGSGFVSQPDPATPPNPDVMPHYTGALKEFKRRQWKKQHQK